MDWFLCARDLRYKRIKLTPSLESTIPDRISTISVSRKLDISIKENAANQNIFPFLSIFLKFEYNTQERYVSGSASSNFKET